MNNSFSHFVAFGYMSFRVISCRFLFDKGLSRMYVELSTHFKIIFMKSVKIVGKSIPQMLFLINFYIRLVQYCSEGLFYIINEEEKLTPTSKYFHLFNLPKCPINGYFGQTDLTFKCST